jgi:hypothetical protein
MKRPAPKPAIAFFLSLAALTLSSAALGGQPWLDIGVNQGQSWAASANPPVAGVDWLTDRSPLLVFPSTAAIATFDIFLGEVPIPDDGVFRNLYHGNVDISVACCGLLNVAGTVAPGVVAGFGLKADPNISVNVQGVGVRTTLALSASPTAVLGDFTFQLRAQAATIGFDRSLSVLFKVMKPWPSDGAPPPCKPTLQIIKLSPLNAYAVKASTNGTSISFRAVSTDRLRALAITVHKPSVPLAPNMAFVTFKHGFGWHTGIRNDNGNNCAMSGTTRVVEEGQTTSFFISTADTTTLVFSKPACRSYFFWVCLDVGLDDTIEFSEGPFWALFGGHQVDIETTGDWGASAFGLGEIEPPS